MKVNRSTLGIYKQGEITMEKIMTLLLQVFALLIPSLKSADSKEGIKETKEMLVGLNELSLLLLGKFKDGVQFVDFTEMYSHLQNDADFKAKLEAAYTNYQAIPAEVKDVDAGEGLELASVQIEYVPKIQAALAKEEKAEASEA